MKSERRVRVKRHAAIGAVIVAGIGLWTWAAASGPEGDGEAPPAVASTRAEERVHTLPPDVSVIPRSEMLSSYPCMECHQHVPAPEVGRIQAMPMRQPHQRIEFEHMRTIVVCSQCHPPGAYNELRLLDDERVSFDEAYLLCGQCHAEKFRDWQWGIHGKQVGKWNGARQRESCPACHPPHHPAVAPMQTTASPPVSKFRIPKGGDADAE